MTKIKQRLKKCWKSLTIAVNGLILSAIPVVEYARANIEEARDYLSPEDYKWVALSLVVANIILRFRTTSDLADK